MRLLNDETTGSPFMHLLVFSMKYLHTIAFTSFHKPSRCFFLPVREPSESVVAVDCMVGDHDCIEARMSEEIDRPPEVRGTV